VLPNPLDSGSTQLILETSSQHQLDTAPASHTLKYFPLTPEKPALAATQDCVRVSNA
jgi:hypothetical protein